MNDGSTRKTSMISARACLPILQVSVEGNYKATETAGTSAVHYPFLLLVSVREDYWHSFQSESIPVSAVPEGEEASRTIELPVLKGQAHVSSAGSNTTLYLLLLGVNGPEQPVLLQIDSVDLVEKHQLIHRDLLQQALAKGRGGLSIVVHQNHGQTHVRVRAL